MAKDGANTILGRWSCNHLCMTATAFSYFREGNCKYKNSLAANIGNEGVKECYIDRAKASASALAASADDRSELK